MKRFACLAAVSPFLALVTACGPNITPLGDDHFKFTVLADFEDGSKNLTDSDLWSGAFSYANDPSPVPAGYAMTFEVASVSPPRTNPDGSESTKALHAADEGLFTYWGTLVFADLRNKLAVDLSGFSGFSIWARSAGKPGTTVKVAFADYGSFDQPGDLPTLCDAVDTSSPNSCYDDYAAKIYPDGAWRRYDVPFSSLTMGGYGYPHTFDLTRVYRIKLAMMGGTKYDLWFDDPAFYLKQFAN
jgi:hypothetical protein